jgi:hypothetical protein
LSGYSLTQVHANNNDLETRPMRDAGYFRVKANLCLDIAGQLSDPRAAADLRADAAGYLARADELESASSPPLPPQSAGEDSRDE